MERANKIFTHKKFKQAMERISECEKDRIYCLHGFDHAMDTARIAYILALEEKLLLDKEIIYAAALLHDVGRFRQYEEGVCHCAASAEAAREILPECGFSPKETDTVAEAILNHGKMVTQSSLAGLLSRADKLSRMCLNCRARDTCKWAENEMNMEIEY